MTLHYFVVLLMMVKAPTEGSENQRPRRVPLCFGAYGVEPSTDGAAARLGIPHTPAISIR